MDELELLKYEIYKKSKKSDYLTFNQFKKWDKIAMIWWELKPKMSSKNTKKDLKNKIIVL